MDDLSYWEDYYIIKYKTLFPNGYNRRFNCKEEIRNEILKKIKEEEQQAISSELATQIYFPASKRELKNMEYGDAIYTWLLLHSHYNINKNCNCIYKADFTYEAIGKDIGRTRQTVSKRLKKLLSSSSDRSEEENLIIESDKCYLLPYFKDSQTLDKELILELLNFSKNSCNEELIKTYVWLLKKYKKEEKAISYGDIITAFGHTKGNKQVYNRYKNNFSILQKAGLVKFNTSAVDLEKNLHGKTLLMSEFNETIKKIKCP
jgi:hypothetical protein